MSKRSIRLPLTLALLLTGLLIPEAAARTAFMLAAYLLAGYDVLRGAVRGVLRGQVFGESFLMSLATVGAIIIGEYAEAVAVMAFYQTGEMFQDYAVDKSRRAIAQAMNLRPDSANLLLEDGRSEAVDPGGVEAGARILVRPGEKIPLDGIVLEGVSQLDTAALTGEALPRAVAPGEEALSGCVNLTGMLTLQVTKPYDQSTVSKILEMVENASDKKSRREAFITRFSAVYTPAVVILALLMAFLPPLLLPEAALQDWVYRSLNFLVVSCPCALVISIPLSFFGGIGGASRAGILMKGSNHLETLARAQTFVFDKTGTLTRGRFTLISIHPQGLSDIELLETAALAEQHSLHPIARAIADAYRRFLNPERVKSVNEQAGGGVSAVVDGKQVLVGSAALLKSHSVQTPPVAEGGTISHVSIDGHYAGHFSFQDLTKPCAGHALGQLRSQGVSRLVMLTGDSRQAGQQVADELGIDTTHAGLLPQDKVARVEELLALPGRRGSLAFVGDGVNDAPVLARADVGIAMGALGSDAAIEAADIVIMNDDPCQIAAALRIAKRTVRIATQNAVFAIAVKALVLSLSALGLSSLWMAVFADVGVAVLAILNAMRALRLSKNNKGCVYAGSMPDAK
jgi:Cd2+/Zn2+-exporting ATPase